MTAPLPSATLPSLDELARSPSMSLTAPVASLAELFERVTAVVNAELLRSMSILPEVIYGAGVACAIATVAGVARLVGFTAVALFVICCVVGTLYGVVRVALGTTRFIDKRSGQDITVSIPLSYGFGYGLVAFGIEAALSLAPVPTVVPAPVLALALLAFWYRRHRPGTSLRIPHLATTRALLQLAEPTAMASVAWSEPAALPADGLQYSAHAARADGTRVTCSSYLLRQGEALQVVADFPSSFRWRHPTPRIVLDGLTLECLEDATGVHVRTTNTHARATGALFLRALSMTAHACAPAAHPPAGPLRTYGA